MAVTGKRKSPVKVARFEELPRPEASPGSTASFHPDLVEKMRVMAASGLNPASALDLLGRLIAEIPSASKDNMDRIKTMDKLINTARSMMETKLKNEEAAAITQRLDELELLVRRMASEQSSLASPSVEVWNKRQQDE